MEMEMRHFLMGRGAIISEKAIAARGDAGLADENAHGASEGDDLGAPGGFVP
jgi:hypothetical protein